jgi:hypothetical protein
MAIEHDASSPILPSRRQVLAGGGLALAGLALSRWAPAAEAAEVAPARGQKPVVLPPAGSKDPPAHALAEMRFWTDILSEHGMFFAMLLPGRELAAERSQAERFQSDFADLHARASAADAGAVTALSRTVQDAVGPFVDWKLRMQEAQASGRIHGLVWPMFFEHAAHEAQRFSRRLSQLQSGSAELDRAEVLEFWGMVMGEHALFIAHLLDPDEVDLVNRAYDAREAFQGLRSEAAGAGRAEHALGLAEEIVDFKSAAQRGIAEGTIKSIIQPALADHVRREALKFVDELRRLDPAAVPARPPSRPATSRVPARDVREIKIEGPPRTP